jgi:hypothetical protein
MKRLLWLFLVSTAFAQINDFGVLFVQSPKTAATAGGAPLTSTFMANVTSGNLGIASVDWFDSTQTIAPSDGTQTWTLIGSANCGTTGGHTSCTQLAYVTFNSTRAETVTVGGTAGASNYVMNVAEYSPPVGGTLTLDTSCTNTSITFSQSTSCTTTANGDLMISASGTWWATDNIYPLMPEQYANGSGSPKATLLSWKIAGVAGVISSTHQRNQFLVASGSPNIWAMTTVAFKPSIRVSTSKLAEASTTQAYSQTLAAVGGTAAYTWSISVGALPTGLSLNASTGAITGTASGAGTSFTVQVTDGTVTATQAESISLGTYQAVNLSQAVSTVFPNNDTITIPSQIQKDDLLVLTLTCPCNNGSFTWVPPVGAHWGDTGGVFTSFRRVTPVVGMGGNNSFANSANVMIITSRATGCVASDIISFDLNSPKEYVVSAAIFRNAQEVIDDTAGTYVGQAGFAAAGSGTFTTTTPNYTAVDDNQVLYAAISQGASLGVTTAGFNTAVTPFTYSNVTLGSFYKQLGAAGSSTVTGTSFQNPANTADNVLMAVGIRPSITSSSCVIPVTQFEKRRPRRPW